MYTRNDSLKEISPTSLCIWWQTLIKESQPISDAFFHFFKNLGWSRILGAAILDLALFARRPRRIFPTSLTGDVTSEIAEDDWERGCVFGCVSSPSCASFALRRTATHNQDHFDEEKVETVRKELLCWRLLKTCSEWAGCRSTRWSAPWSFSKRRLLPYEMAIQLAQSLNQSRYLRERVPSRTWTLTTCR